MYIHLNCTDKLFDHTSFIKRSKATYIIKVTSRMNAMESKYPIKLIEKLQLFTETSVSFITFRFI